MILYAMLGKVPIGRVWLGSTPSLSYAPCYDGFDRDNRALCTSDRRWVDYGPSTDYKAVIESGKLRIGIPDVVETPIERVSYARYNYGIAPKEDGHLECRVVTRGDSDTTIDGELRYYTAVFAKTSLTMTDGVGIYLAASQLNLVVRRDKVDNIVESFGTYSAGDIIRLEFTGREYAMYCKGQLRGYWTDTRSEVATGSTHRALGIRVHGSHQGTGSGPRRFSPSLDFVEYA